MTEREKKQFRMLKNRIEGMEVEVLNHIEEDMENMTQDYIDSLEALYVSLISASSVARLRLIRSKKEAKK